MTHRTFVAATFAFALAAAVSLSAQGTATQRQLQQATNVACEFVLMTSADWARDGAPTAAVKLHFMQVTSPGALYTTTVFDQVSRPGKLKAVHTRHEWQAFALPGYSSRPEQYYGECEVTAAQP
jgi:hypothetical protein